ncbi:GlxA family transcriptional regulator [Propionivibrio soli]|uniref:GlxA family transcriptional regulator n=1 Tax=Propionivibrio soli TaxID=2976531 RepID=UPI0021E8CDB1|nr:helix-turn-helix domain-containing protein [Propionivibrio soli]
MRTKPGHTIAVIAFDGISPFPLSVPCLVFGESKVDAPFIHPPLDLLVCSAGGTSLATSAGFTISASHGLRATRCADTIIVPSWPDPDVAPPEELIAALQAAERRGALIVGLCLGSYVLAEAGLLDGCRATTHWAYAGDFARRYPRVQVDADVLYVEDGNVLTSAGTAAGIDCCLHLLRRWCGAEYANHVARRLVVPPHRQGGQAQFVEQPLPESAGDARLAGLIDWVRANLQLPHTLDSLSEKALMSRRTFTRHFRALTGNTVLEWLLSERLRLTQRLLEAGDQSVERIAASVGFGSPVSLRLHFRKAFGVSPNAWRRTFKGG